jgi:hypothetical protein
MTITPLLVALVWTGISAVLFVSTFIFYLSILKLRDVHASGVLDQLHISVRLTAYFILSVGLLLDTMLNWIFLSVTFLELPREFLSTKRVIRHKYNSPGWRQSQAYWWCMNWLAPFDSRHCEKALAKILLKDEA